MLFKWFLCESDVKGLRVPLMASSKYKYCIYVLACVLCQIVIEQ